MSKGPNYTMSWYPMIEAVCVFCKAHTYTRNGILMAHSGRPTQTGKYAGDGLWVENLRKERVRPSMSVSTCRRTQLRRLPRLPLRQVRCLPERLCPRQGR